MFFITHPNMAADCLSSLDRILLCATRLKAVALKVCDLAFPVHRGPAIRFDSDYEYCTDVSKYFSVTNAERANPPTIVVTSAGFPSTYKLCAHVCGVPDDEDSPSPVSPSYSPSAPARAASPLTKLFDGASVLEELVSTVTSDVDPPSLCANNTAPAGPSSNAVDCKPPTSPSPRSSRTSSPTSPAAEGSLSSSWLLNLNDASSKPRQPA